MLSFKILSEGPGVGRRIKKILIEKKSNFFSLCRHPATHECPQKSSSHSDQPFYPARGNIYTKILFYLTLETDGHLKLLDH